MNCTKTHVHAESCTSKWFDLRANFTQCENADESREFNRLEYQRQQLANQIAQLREKRSAAPTNAIARGQTVNVSGEIPLTQRSAVRSVPPTLAIINEPTPHKPLVSKIGLKAAQASKRSRVLELKDEDLAQQIADWPENQPAPEGPDMQYDAAEIANFLQHAARFILRYEPAPNQEDIDLLMKNKIGWLYGRPKGSVSDAELAVRTVQGWQLAQEMQTMVQNVPGWTEGRGEERNPIGFQIHRFASGRREVTPHVLENANVRVMSRPREPASLVEIFEKPEIKPAQPWLLRLSYLEGSTIAISDENGDINEISEESRDLSDGLCVRTNGGMLHFDGPPTFDVSLDIEYADRVMRLRLCTNYVIIDEQFRLDQNGVSGIMKNTNALDETPKWEISFLGAKFESTRVRFGRQRARLQLRDGELDLTAVGHGPIT